MTQSIDTSKMKVVVKKEGAFENLYLLNVPVFYANVLKSNIKEKFNKPAPDAKNQSQREYSVTAFFSSVIADQLAGDVKLNKTLAEVGVDKTKTRKLKYPLTAQLPQEMQDKGRTGYDLVEGLTGCNLTANEFTNKGTPYNLTVLDKDGQPWDEDVLIGNGSVCNIKMYGYRNRDGLLNATLQLVQVLDLVPYEGGTGGGVVEDDVLGIKYEVGKKQEAKVEEAPAKDDSNPFDDFDDNDDFE